MRRKLIIDGNAVYEIDDECARCQEGRQDVNQMGRNVTDSQQADLGGSQDVYVGENDKKCRKQAGEEKDIHFY